MKFETWNRVITVTLLATLAIPAGMAAQQTAKPDHTPKQHHYQLIDLGTLGGNNSYFANYVFGAPILNHQGTVVASSETSMPDPFPNSCFEPDCLAAHAVAWKNGVLTDWGALPGGENSAPQWLSANGLSAGLSENGMTDPLVPGLPEYRATLWQDGGITDLGTLEGGYESVAYAVNSQGQVSGEATNTIPDPFSQAFDQTIGVPYQTRAFFWQNGVMQDLGTLGGPDASATVMNERGQIAGGSYINSMPNQTGCNPGVPTVHGFLWENDKMIDLKSLGGHCAGVSAINNRGQVAGGSTLPGDQEDHPTLWDHGTLSDLGTFGGSFGFTSGINENGAVVGTASYPGDTVQHAALWKKGTRTDLGSLPGYGCSFAYFINSSDQIVGSSFACDGSTNAATLWQNGAMVDLNTLIPPNSALHLDLSLDINDHGEIAGQGSLANGDTHAFLLIPCDENHPGVEGCDHSLEGAAEATREIPTPAAHKPTMARLTLRPFGRRGLTSIPGRAGARQAAGR